MSTKKRASRRAFAARSGSADLLRRAALLLEPLARLLGLLLQFLLQLLLLLLEHLRIGGRPLVRLGEIGQRKREADLVAGEVDRLDGQHLALLELADQVGGPLVVRHAAVREAGEERHRDRRLLLVDDKARAVAQLQRARQRDAEDLLRLTV